MQYPKNQEAFGYFPKHLSKRYIKKIILNRLHRYGVGKQWDQNREWDLDREEEENGWTSESEQGA